MVEVSNVVLKYSQKGAKDVQRADSNVRDSISQTSKKAEEEAGTIDRWMSRHKTALLAIGTATAGLMAGIVKATPGLRAGLSSIRLAFSLMAFEIGQHLVPYMMDLEEAIWDQYDAWQDLDDSITEPIEKFIALAAAVTTLTVAFTGLARVFAPLFKPINGLTVALAGLFTSHWLTRMIAVSKQFGILRGAAMALSLTFGSLAKALGLGFLARWAGQLALIIGGSKGLTAVLKGGVIRQLQRMMAIPVVAKIAGWAVAITKGLAAILGISVGWAAALIAVIVGVLAIGIWNDRFDIIHDAMDRFWGRIVQTAGAWAKIFTDLFGDMWAIVQAIFDEDTSVLLATWEMVKNLVINILDALVITVVNIIGGLGDLVIILVGGLVSGVVDLFWWAVNEIGIVLNHLLSMVPGSWEELKKDTIAIWDSMVQGIIDLAHYLWDVLVGNSIIPDMVADIVASFKGLDIDVRKVVSKMVSGVVGFFGNLRTKVDEKTRKLYTSVTGRMSELYTGVTGSLSSLAADATSTVGGLHDNVSSKFYSLKSTVISTTSDLTENATTSVGSMASSILGDADKMASGVVSDIRDMASSTVDEIRGMEGDISSRLSGLTSDARSWGRDMMTSFRDQISRYSSRVSRAADRLAREIDRSLNLERDANRWGRDIGRELSSGLRSARSDIDSAGSSLRSTIESHLSFDRIDNDRAARRWGSDFVQEWSKGLQSEWSAFERGMPSMDASMGSMTPGSGGTQSSSTTVNIEQGAIQIRGGRAVGGKIDESELADEVADRFGSQVGGRTR